MERALERGRIRRSSKLLIATIAALATFFVYPKAFADKFNTEASAETAMLGMGNAGINLSRGPYSVFYNPANIAAKETGTHLELVNMQFDMSEGYLSMLGGGKYASPLSLGSIYGAIKDKPNTYSGGRVSIYPNITLRNISLGMLYEVNQGAMLQAVNGNLRVKARDRLVPTAAISQRLANGIFRLGASAQWVTVGNADTLIAPPIPAALDFKSSINSVSGFALNAGTTLTMPFRFLPSFSLVARDIGGTRFKGPPLAAFGAGRESYTQAMTFDFGSSMLVLLGRRLELKLGLDYRDLTNKLSGGRFRHVFAGSELVFYELMRFRAGIAHGYPSFGFGLVTKKASIDIAIYADELDDRLRGTREQRYSLQYTWGLFQ